MTFTSVMNVGTEISSAVATMPNHRKSLLAQEQKAQDILRTCVRYGFCITTCPTHVLLHDENDSPRGRISLIREMLDSAGPPSAKTVEHLDRCLSCLSCMTTCAANVDYAHLIDYARAHISRTYRRPWLDRLIRAFIANTLPYPSRVAALLRLAPLGRLMAPLLPAPMVAMLKLAPSATAALRSTAQRRRYPASAKYKARVALLTGCVQRVIADHINAATIRVLNQAGADVIVLPEINCCGALTLHMGREIEGKRSARGAIEAWYSEVEREGLDAIVVNASGCGTVLKDYAQLFADNHQLAYKADKISRLACDVTELLMRLGLPEATTPRRYKICYHDACSLQHGQKVTIPPRSLLKSMGYVVVEVPERHFCCGSAGTYNMLQPKIATALGERKAKNIESTTPQMALAGNLGCITQIAAYTALPVLHTVEAVDWAMGGPLPSVLIGRDLLEEPNAHPENEAAGFTRPDVGANRGDLVW
jgi:glycolate oxidase iron-sulfur subunit